PTPQLVSKKGESPYLQRGDDDKDLPRRFQPDGSLEQFVPLLTGEKLVVEYRDSDLATFVAEVYGLRLAEEGLWQADEPIIEYIVRETPAADAQLKRGDVIIEVNAAHI